MEFDHWKSSLLVLLYALRILHIDYDSRRRTNDITNLLGAE